MIIENKITEIFCIADDFCKVFDAQMEKYTIKCNAKRKYHRESTMSKADYGNHHFVPQLRLSLLEAFL